MKRHLIAPAVAVLALALVTPACAELIRQDRYGSYDYDHYSDVRRIAYDRGFREGARDGERDARRGSAFRYEDERAFRRADLGYRRHFGDIDHYRRSFRSGFAEGYTRSYRRIAGAYAPGRRSGGYGGYERGRTTHYATPYDVGARDGYEKGRDDARANRVPNPRLHKWYRAGDRHYDRRYGNRRQYADEYRRGFLAGYEQAYRQRR